jgi:hypothetical protein
MLFAGQAVVSILVPCRLYPSYRLHGDSIAGFRRLVSSRPGARGKFSDSFDREIRHARQDRAKIVANRDFESSAGFDDRDDGCHARSSFLASDVYPVVASKRDRAHRVLSQVVTQFQLGMFQETGQPRPKRQCIVASLSHNALWQCAGAYCLDLGLDLLEQRLGLLQPQKLTVLLA